MPNSRGLIGKRDATAFVCTRFPVESEFIVHNKAKLAPNPKAIPWPNFGLIPSYI